jgi:hypothetical protein
MKVTPASPCFERLAADNAGEQVDVLLDVGADVVVGDTLAVDLVLIDAAAALTAKDRFRDIGVPRGMPAEGVHADAVFVLVFHGEVVPDVAHVFGIPAGSDRTASHAHSADGVVVHHPVDHIDVMHMLLDDVVAAQPQEVVPVVNLIGGIRLTGTAIAEPDASAIPGATGGNDVPDGSLMDAADRFDVPFLMAALGAGDDGEFFGVGLVDEGITQACPGSIDGDGLFRPLSVCRTDNF